jgi:signal transduction histidine kinase
MPSTWWLRIAIYVACALAFAADMTHSDTLAFGVFYIPLVGTAIYHADPRAAWWLAALASAMVAAGYFFPSIDANMIASATNRLLSIGAICTTAFLVSHERRMREDLAEQTRRAQAAERAKTQLFANLSHELRTPLAAILGFADLLSSDARPDQRSGLSHIQSGGRRLLATVDNLIDLTQFEDRTMRSRPMDLPALLNQAVEASQPAATERQVTLSLLSPDETLPPVMADGWALRRIVDNLVANGIKFTEPGGSVEVSAGRASGGIAATIKDTGAGMSPEVLRQIGEPFFQADTGIARRFEGMGTGLALSLRLAAIMGAKLSFDSTPGKGTAVTLLLAPANR